MIEPAMSERASPMALAPEKDGKCISVLTIECSKHDCTGYLPIVADGLVYCLAGYFNPLFYKWLQQESLADYDTRSGL